MKFGHGKILTAGLAITFVGLVALALFRSSIIGVLVTVAIFGFGVGLAQVGNTNLISCACTKENFGSMTAVNSMILTIGMSVGPVLAGLVVGEFADASSGYAYSWVITGALALLAGMLVLLNRAKLTSESVSPVPQNELPGASE